MPEFPKKELLQKLIPYLLDVKKHYQPPLLKVTDLKNEYSLNNLEYKSLFHWFFEMKIWRPIGDENLQLTDYIDDFEQRFGVRSSHLDFHLLHQFSNERRSKDILKQFLSSRAVAAFIDEVQASDQPLKVASELLQELEKQQEKNNSSKVKVSKESEFLKKWTPDSPEKILVYILIVKEIIQFLTVEPDKRLDQTTIINNITIIQTPNIKNNNSSPTDIKTFNL